MLMVAAQYAEPEVLQFLLDQAAAVKPSILFSSEQEPLLLRYVAYFSTVHHFIALSGTKYVYVCKLNCQSS